MKNLYRTLNHELNKQEAYDLGFRNLATISSGYEIFEKGFLNKKISKTAIVEIDDNDFLTTYCFNRYETALNILEQDYENKDELLNILENESFRKKTEQK